MDEIKLKVCPCCGGQPVVLVAPAGRQGESVRIECSGCRLSTAALIVGGRRETYNRKTRALEVSELLSLADARRQAAKLWNRREDGTSDRNVI